MTIQFDVEQMRELMRSFHRLSGIRFVLFDSEFHELIAYPEDNGALCKLMKSCGKTKRKCTYADRRSFEKCEKSHSLVLYKCHAGLVEAVIPLHENEEIVGYLMFGQITDCTDKTPILAQVPEWVSLYGFDEQEIIDAIEAITCKSEEEILAAAKIMEACTSYILYKELITPADSRVLQKAKAYIEDHLGEDIEIEALCRELRVSRTKLYEIFRQEMKQGISKYILRRRMHRAKKLLKTTELPIPEIAGSVGFLDYNYFSRVYKKTYGKSPKHYR